jgi:hypothetical protein
MWTLYRFALERLAGLDLGVARLESEKIAGQDLRP